MKTARSHQKKSAGDGAMSKRGLFAIPALDRNSAFVHAFTTRQNGLGARTGGARQPDDWSAVADAFGIHLDRIATVNQVHGENIVRINELNILGSRSVHADALMTDVPGIAVGVETADCVPILLFDPARPAVAAVHAGWRSTVKKIVQKAVNRMHEEFRSDPSRLVAAIGPAIGPECYEVDEPVMGPVQAAFSFWREVAAPRGSDRWSLDLVRANQIELMQIGLDGKNIHTAGMCTSCRKDLFYSYRSEGRTGRMLSVIMLKP